MEINQICGSKQVEDALSRGEWKLRTRQLPLGQRVQRAREPYKTIFTLAAVSGLRAGELLGLTVADVDFERLTVCPRKQADEPCKRAARPKDEEVADADSDHAGNGTRSPRSLENLLEAKSARAAVSEPRRATPQASQRCEVWASSYPGEVGTCNPQSRPARIPARTGHGARKRRSVAGNRAENPAAHGHQNHHAVLRSRGRRHAARDARSNSTITNVAIVSVQKLSCLV